MMVDVEMAIYHYHFMTRYYESQRDGLEISDIKKEYHELMKKAIVSEINIVVSENHSNIYHSVLSMYMRSNVLTGFVKELFNSKEMLTPKIIHIAWSQGNIYVIQNCMELGIDTEPQRNVSCVIRSDCIKAVDMCVELGASLDLPLLPYRHCRSVKMVNHLSKKYNCKLHYMATKIPGNNLVSTEYVFLGGHIGDMGYLNEQLRSMGNKERSLPIKRAYVRSIRKGNVETLEGIGRFLLLPGFVVKNITDYI